MQELVSITIDETTIAKKVAKRLSGLDSSNLERYAERARQVLKKTEPEELIVGGIIAFMKQGRG